jgi:hypothetical protein
MYYVNAQGEYHEGSKYHGDTLVPQRPSSFHVWDFQAEEWVLDQQAYNAAQLQAFDEAIEAELDRQAAEAGYYHPQNRIPNIDRACSYASYPNPYQAESQSFVAWRAAVWSYVYEVKTQVDANQRTAPTIEELIQELPERVMPE